MAEPACATHTRCSGHPILMAYVEDRTECAQVLSCIPSGKSCNLCTSYSWSTREAGWQAYRRDSHGLLSPGQISW